MNSRPRRLTIATPPSATWLATPPNTASPLPAHWAACDLQVLRAERTHPEPLAQRLDQRLDANGGLHDILRRLRDKGLHLAEQRRQDGHADADGQQHRHDGHGGGGHRARQAETLQARDDGVEEIGHNHADHEGQQDVVQEPEDEQKDGRRRQPEIASGRR